MNTVFTRDALEYAIRFISREGGNVEVVQTLQSILDQRGCTEIPGLEHDSLPENIDIIVFG